MCEAVEKYARQKAKEASIVEGIAYGATKEQIVERLVKKYKVNQKEAEKLYEIHAASAV